jgi:hypothetical protein
MHTDGSMASPRRPIAPRVADRTVKRPVPMSSPRDVIAVGDNPLRGWRVIPAIPLVDRAWRRGIETNVVACYLTARRHGDRGELMMGLAPYLVLLGCFGAVMTTSAVPARDIWLLVLFLAFLLPLLSLFMGALLMGWGLRRCLVGLSVDQLMVTPLKAEAIVRGLAIRPVWRISAIVLFISLCVPLVMALGVARAGHAFSEEWLLLGFLAWLISYSGSILMGQLGAALAMRAHVYVRTPSMASARTFADVLSLFVRLSLLAIALGWICGLFVVGIGLLTGNSPFVAVRGFTAGGFSGFTAGLAFGLLFGALFVGMLVAAITIIYQLVAGLVDNMESAVEFTYLYPEEWWINNVGRDVEEDTYRLGVPWIPPHSERMMAIKTRFRSRAS